MAGLFGKLPTSGDFLSRGLANGQRAWLDQWLTRWLAGYAADPELWPPGGLRALLDAPDGPLLAVIGPSVDLPGRSFPILACVAAPQTDRAGADRWADLAAVALSRAVAGTYDADTLLAALETVAAPSPGGAPLSPPWIWSGEATEEISGPPETAIPQIFGDQISSD